MKLPSNQLEAFYILAQEKNFTRAAAKIGLSQPALSHRIKSLESFLESTLFIRSKNEINLTDLGRRLLKHVQTQQNIENEFLNELENQFQDNEIKGQIRIAAFSSIARSIVIPAFVTPLKENQNLSIQLYTDELRNLPELLYSSKADFIVYNQEIVKDGFESIHLGIEKNFHYEPKSGINKDIFLDHDETDATTSGYFKIARQQIPTKKRYLDDVYGLVDGVKQELGSAILPQHLADKKTMRLKNKQISLDVPIYLCYRTAPYYTKIHQLVIKELKKAFKYF